MGRPKGNGEISRASYALDNETKEMIKEISKFEGMYQSEFIGFLVRNWDAGLDPTTKLNNLLEERKKMAQKLDEIEEQIYTLTAQIKQFDEWRKQKSEKKGIAIANIKRKILARDYVEAERIARVWQRITGVPAIELITEASGEIEKTGI